MDTNSKVQIAVGIGSAVFAYWLWKRQRAETAGAAPAVQETPQLSGGVQYGGPSIDWSLFSSGGTEGNAIPDYSHVTDALVGAFIETLNDTPNPSAGNSNLFPLFGYAAGGSDFVVRNYESVAQSVNARERSAYQSVAPSPTLVQQSTPVETAQIWSKEWNRFITVQANSAEKLQTQLNADYYAKQVAADNESRNPYRWM